MIKKIELLLLVGILFTAMIVSGAVWFYGYREPVGTPTPKDTPIPETILFDIAKFGSSDDIKNALEKGADVSTKTESGYTLLMQAARYNRDPNVIEALVKNGADVNSMTSEGATPLAIAVCYNSPDMTMALIKNGADVHAKDKLDRTPLMLAARYASEVEHINILLENDADANESLMGDGPTPLFIAVAFNENPAIVKALIDSGVNVNAKNSMDWSPLMTAALYNTSEVVALLIEAGADVNTISDTIIMTPIVQAASEGKRDVVELLVANGADANIKDTHEKTPLIMLATITDKPEAIEILLDVGADANAKDISGLRAIDYAKGNKHLLDTDAYRRLLAASE